MWVHISTAVATLCSHQHCPTICHRWLLGYMMPALQEMPISVKLSLDAAWTAQPPDLMACDRRCRRNGRHYGTSRYVVYDGAWPFRRCSCQQAWRSAVQWVSAMGWPWGCATQTQVNHIVGHELQRFAKPLSATTLTAQIRDWDRV